MTVNLVFLLLAVSRCGLAGPVTFTHSNDYGPYGGDGTSFLLKLDWQAPGEATLSSHLWIVPDGEYRGSLSAEDRQQLYCLVAQVRSASSPLPSFWICPHSPDFEVQIFSNIQGGGFTTNACVENVATSPLASIFDLVQAAVRRASWSNFTPRPSDRAVRSTGPLPDLPRGRSLKLLQ